jgi:hypothetical protein
MSFLCWAQGLQSRSAKEQVMDWIAALPEWLVWCAAGAIGVVALTTIARTLQAALDLDAS